MFTNRVGSTMATSRFPTLRYVPGLSLLGSIYLDTNRDSDYSPPTVCGAKRKFRLRRKYGTEILSAFEFSSGTCSFRSICPTERAAIRRVFRFCPKCQGGRRHHRTGAPKYKGNGHCFSGRNAPALTGDV